MSTIDSLGRPLNPDTALPYPSASQAQLELVEEVWDGLAGRIDVSTEDAGLIRDALTEAVVRQHGRTTRAHIAELRADAASQVESARAALAEAVSEDGSVRGSRVMEANTLIQRAFALDTAVLRGDRA